MRFFAGCLLAEVVLAGAIALTAWTSGLWVERQWRAEAIAAEGDLSRCTQQRDAFARRLRTGERMR